MKWGINKGPKAYWAKGLKTNGWAVEPARLRAPTAQPAWAGGPAADERAANLAQPVPHLPQH